MGLPVAVEIAPPTAPRQVAAQREQVVALLSACTRAVAQSECVLAGEGAPSATLAVAIVTWESPTHVIVEVGLRQPEGPQWRTRNLDFTQRDNPIERWKTVGFVVGILARGETLPEEGAASETAATKPRESIPEVPAPEPKPKPQEKTERSVSVPPKRGPVSRVEPPASEPEPERSRLASRGPARARVDLGFGAGPALGETKLGATVRTVLPLWGPLRSTAALQYSWFQVPAEDFSLAARWLTLSAGVGGTVGSQTLQGLVALEARSERVSMDAARDELRQIGTRWLFGVATHASVTWLPLLPFGFFAGGELGWMAGSTEVRVLGNRVARDGQLRGLVQAGVSIRLW